jgi:hypothetical protein
MSSKFGFTVRGEWIARMGWSEGLTVTSPCFTITKPEKVWGIIEVESGTIELTLTVNPVVHGFKIRCVRLRRNLH